MNKKVVLLFVFVIVIFGAFFLVTKANKSSNEISALKDMEMYDLSLYDFNYESETGIKKIDIEEYEYLSDLNEACAVIEYDSAKNKIIKTYDDTSKNIKLNKNYDYYVYYNGEYSNNYFECDIDLPIDGKKVKFYINGNYSFNILNPVEVSSNICENVDSIKDYVYRNYIEDRIITTTQKIISGNKSIRKKILENDSSASNYILEKLNKSGNVGIIDGIKVLKIEFADLEIISD